jgi:hypothetical protein
MTPDSYLRPDRCRTMLTMRPTAVNSLLRSINSLLGRKNSPFRIEQGICRNALGLPGESRKALPKRGQDGLGCTLVVRDETRNRVCFATALFDWAYLARSETWVTHS